MVIMYVYLHMDKLDQERLTLCKETIIIKELYLEQQNKYLKKDNVYQIQVGKQLLELDFKKFIMSKVKIF